MKNEEKKVLNEKNEKSEKKELNDKDIEQVTGGKDEVVVPKAPEIVYEIAHECADTPTSNAY